MKGILPLLILASATHAYDTREEMIQGCHQKIIAMSPKNKLLIFSPIEGNDRPEELVDDPHHMVRRPLDMEARNLLAGTAKNIPWSDSYWPIYRGGLGQRYNDPDFAGYEWKEAHDYVLAKPAAGIVRDGQLDRLSPSEKYDYLLGLTGFPFTAAQWSDGQEYFSRRGRVESWMGYCHGWAPASMMMPEPKKKISAGKLTFYPSDVKGLATMTWAKGNFATRFIGGRCNTENPSTDRNGRPNDENCLDNNPGSWHLVVVNQLGLSKRPFIMDASYDYQVWNHPVYSYDYTYFNPRTEKVAKFSEAAEKPGSWDKRKSVRSPSARTIVGVRMTVNYAVENEPTVEEDQPSESSSATYEYDLELNQQGEIIGGEWHDTSHPDFLWVPEPGVFPSTVGDQLPVDLSAVSRELREAARSGAKQGLPSGSVVKELVRLSLGDE